ncbi:MAG TPA: carboxypeptidase regulatory-like domain-containing protein [Candidatus Acidoferrales bacterium]|nr:carboxypeptidase regulatory-like domain-containing protein [Candidatus Acidoferrales bacterium]
MRSYRIKLLGVFVVALFVASICLSQNITAYLTGTVTDPSGAVVSGASVTLHNVDLNTDVITVKTDSGGAYTATELPLGTYTVSVEATGFKKFLASDVVLHVGEHRTLDIKLEVGQVTEQVTVTAATVPIETSSAAQDTTITGTQIRELQLNNRNFEQLVALQPGVANGLPDQVGFGIENTDDLSVNGARGSANNWTVDGADINDSGSNSTLLNVPSVDALSEFTLERSTYDAQYGRSGGGQVNVVTKSGTNQFHGDAYEFVRNDVFDANEWFNKQAGNAKPPFRYNDFGYTVGGPFFIPDHYNTDKTKTFFFFSEEFRRTRTPGTSILALPNPQELTGNFAGLFNADGTAVSLNPATAPSGCISGNQISSTCFSPNAVAYINNIYTKFTPNSSLDATALSENFTFPVSAADNFRQEIIRVDQKITNKIQAFGRYMQDSVPTTEPGGLFAGGNLPGVSSTTTNAPGRNVVAHVTMQLSQNVTNEIAYSDSWGAINSRITGIINSPAFVSALNFGPSGLPFADPYGRVPGISISGVQGVGIPVSPYFERNVDKNIYDNVAYTKGNHTLRAGASVQFMKKSENAVNPTNGSFSFGDDYGNPAFANFLLGNADGFSQTSRDIIPNLHFPNIEAYVQDDWKIHHNFTLNIGLRYSYLPPPEDYNHILDNFSPAAFNLNATPILDPVTGAFVLNQPASPQNYANGIIIAQNACNPNAYFEPPVALYGPTCSPYGDRVNPVYHSFAPRIGFAWDVFGDGKTAVRGGYGVYYDRSLNGIEEQNSFANPPFVGSVNVTVQTANGADIFDNPTSGSVVPPTSPTGLHATGNPAFQVPYIQQWSLSVERELLPSTRLEVAYVGNKGSRLLGIYDLNQVPLNVREAAGNQNTEANLLRPYAGYAAISIISPQFSSNYNSLQVSLNRRVSRGLTIDAAYTWSKTLTNNPSDRSDAAYNTYNFAADYGPASFSLGQVFVVSYVYELPFYRAQQGLVGHVLGGWEVSGISNFQSGFPTTIYQFFDPFNSIHYAAGTPNTFSGGIGIDPSPVAPRPDRAPGASCSGPGTFSQFINTGAFTDAIGHFGSSGRGVCTGPGQNNWDLSAIKNTKINERLNLQFRAEFYNAFNHESFNSFDNYTDDFTFGQLNGGHDPRIIQLGMKLYF